VQSFRIAREQVRIVEKAPEPVLSEADKKALVNLLEIKQPEEAAPEEEVPDLAELTEAEAAEILEKAKSEAKAQAEAITDTAKKEAAEIIETAKSDANAIRSIAGSDAAELRADAKLLGYNEGIESAKADAEEQLKLNTAAKTQELEADFREKFAAETEQLRAAYELQLEQLRGEALDFALSVVHKIFGENRDELYAPLIVNALEKLGTDDSDISIETDYGKVVIDVGSETIDASIYSQLERLRESATGG
jgi:F0F1-type ATP synthase membrane subunit b/b'